MSAEMALAEEVGEREIVSRTFLRVIDPVLEVWVKEGLRA
jgi:hypothetical protein